MPVSGIKPFNQHVQAMLDKLDQNKERQGNSRYQDQDDNQAQNQPQPAEDDAQNHGEEIARKIEPANSALNTLVYFRKDIFLQAFDLQDIQRQNRLQKHPEAQQEFEGIEQQYQRANVERRPIVKAGNNRRHQHQHYEDDQRSRQRHSFENPLVGRENDHKDID